MEARLPPWLSERLVGGLAERCQRLSADEPPVIVLCSSPLARASVNHLARLQQPRLIVMSVEEISRDTEVESLGPLTISLTEPDADTHQLLAA